MHPSQNSDHRHNPMKVSIKYLPYVTEDFDPPVASLRCDCIHLQIQVTHHETQWNVAVYNMLGG